MIDRLWKVAKSAVFFMQCYFADADHVAVENPVGYMSTLLRKPDCIIDPYFLRKVKKMLKITTRKELACG